MSKSQSMRPEDILPEGIDTVESRGVTVRKGTVAAYIANISVVENDSSTTEEKEKALAVMKELAPSIIAMGLHDAVTFKNIQAEKILNESADAERI